VGRRAARPLPATLAVTRNRRLPCGRQRSATPLLRLPCPCHFTRNSIATVHWKG
jgi:hypothetical protein